MLECSSPVVSCPGSIISQRQVNWPRRPIVLRKRSARSYLINPDPASFHSSLPLLLSLGQDRMSQLAESTMAFNREKILGGRIRRKFRLFFRIRAFRLIWYARVIGNKILEIEISGNKLGYAYLDLLLNRGKTKVKRFDRSSLQRFYTRPPFSSTSTFATRRKHSRAERNSRFAPPFKFEKKILPLDSTIIL